VHNPTEDEATPQIYLAEPDNPLKPLGKRKACRFWNKGQSISNKEVLTKVNKKISDITGSDDPLYEIE